jgi:hypothetical protein
MSYVWIVQGFDSGGTDILGVFNTEEKAEEFKDSDCYLTEGFAFISVSKREVE